MTDKEKQFEEELELEVDEAELSAAQPGQEEASPAQELEKKCAELNDRYLRLMAEYDNYRKRTAKEKTELFPQATAAAVQKFLPLLDNLERAAGYDKMTEEFAKGFDLICQSFSEILESLGVEAVGAEGETFNPELHNAVMHIENPELGENVISQVLQKGYRLGDRVIRHAVVQTAN